MIILHWRLLTHCVIFRQSLSNLFKGVLHVVLHRTMPAHAFGATMNALNLFVKKIFTIFINIFIKKKKNMYLIICA